MKQILIVFIFFSLTGIVFAQEDKIEYEGGIILDSDLDGLTDQGEEKFFKTDSQDPDTDGDGIFDGVEVIKDTNPLDIASPSAVETITEKKEIRKENTPWVWYTVRALGLVGFALLYLSMFFGFAIRIPFLKKYFGIAKSMDLHKWFSIQAVLLIFFHGILMLFDSYYKFSLLDIFVPFYSSFNPLGLSLGIISFYLMVIIGLSSFLMGKIKASLWKAIHSLSIFLYVGGVVHAFSLGTDLKNPLMEKVFSGANILLFFVFVLFLFYIFKNKLQNKKV